MADAPRLRAVFHGAPGGRGGGHRVICVGPLHLPNSRPLGQRCLKMGPMSPHCSLIPASCCCMLPKSGKSHCSAMRPSSMRNIEISLTWTLLPVGGLPSH